MLNFFVGDANKVEEKHLGQTKHSFITVKEKQGSNVRKLQTTNELNTLKNKMTPLHFRFLNFYCQSCPVGSDSE